jgi:hypothetical protein
MDDRPVIGITTTNLKALDGIPSAVPDSWAMSQGFITAPTAAGAPPSRRFAPPAPGLCVAHRSHFHQRDCGQ